MSQTSNSNPPATTKQIEHLYWPPKHLLPPAAASSNDRIDLLTYLDAEVYNTRGTYPMKLPYGVTVLRDRVVLEQERFSSPSRDHQTALASQFQASFAEQGFAVVVKEWANPTQKRSILRVRLKCRFAGCKFHFQINWDQNMGYWFISRRRCGIFQHSCRAHDGSNQVETVPNKRPVADSPPPPPPFGPPANKRTRVDPQEQGAAEPDVHQPYLITPQMNGSQPHSLRTVSCEQSPAAPEQPANCPPPKKGDNPAMDFAESLLELSKGKTGSVQDENEALEQQREPSSKETPEDPSREHPKQTHPQAPPSSSGPHHHNVRPRSIVLGEIPHGTQAFAQMASTMGPNLFSHLVHNRGEMNLTMTFDGEGFVLRTSVPSVPPSMPHSSQHHPHAPMDSKSQRMPPLNYPYLPPRHFPPPSRNETAVVML
ncbi:hypothetical protein ACA910_021330 [Epithemia clementina (nom. ined.)]